MSATGSMHGHVLEVPSHCETETLLIGVCFGGFTLWPKFIAGGFAQFYFANLGGVVFITNATFSSPRLGLRARRTKDPYIEVNSWDVEMSILIG